MTGNSITIVNLSDVAVSLEAHDSANHALVLATQQGTLKIVGNVDDLRAEAMQGLTLPIPALPAAPVSSRSASASGGSDDSRLSAIEATLARLTDIADRAQRRGLI
jgi:hypothetical protein